MWWAGSEATLYLAAGVMVLYPPGGKGGVKVPCTRVETSRWEAALDGVLDHLLAGGTKRLRVVLSSHFARPFVLSGGMGLHGRNEVLQVAGSLAAEETGLEPPFQLWADTYRNAEPCLIVAAEQGGINFVLDRAAQRSLQVTEIEPVWMVPICEQLQMRTSESARGLVVVKEADGLAWFVLHGTGVHQAGFEQLPPPATSAWLHRIMLANDVAAKDLRTASIGVELLGHSGPDGATRRGKSAVPVIWERVFS